MTAFGFEVKGVFASQFFAVPVRILPVIIVSTMNDYDEGNVFMSILKRGLKGAPVKRLQQKLGIGDDGDFGPGTEKALKDWQAANGLTADGIAGPDTFAAMGLHELILLRKGSRGAQVKKLQEGLSIGADGMFGTGTAQAVIDFQGQNGLIADGIAGPATLEKLSTFAEITATTVQKAAIKPEEEHFETQPLPELDGTTFGEPEEIAAAEPPKSVWGRVKGWF